MPTRSRRVTLAVAALLSGLGTVTVPVAQAAQDAGCAHTKIFEVGGAGDGQGLVYDEFNAGVPAGVETEKIVYAAEIAPFPGHEKTMDQSVEEGMAALEEAVLRFAESCEDSTVIIVGYSMGALVAGNVLDTFAEGEQIPHEVLKGVLYGDPRRPGDPASGSDGSAGGGAGGVATNIPTFFPGMTLQGPRPGDGDVAVTQICNQNDGICNSVNPFTNALAFANGWAGYLNGAHAYDIDPLRDVDRPDVFLTQPPLIPYGPPLPLSLPNPYELADGDIELSQAVVRQVRDALRAALPEPMWQRLIERLPWLDHL
ncbi:PE-PPE domain-containing protein [Saccharomonospora xinjiangensis]|uniref:PE-PPE domain-containing protein n=1 Tax=Saccharomonospora xinjiangensis TaxID=75294 RepID=UPI00350E9A1F